MAKTVFRIETLELLDGSQVKLKSLNIKKMKEFQARFASLQNDSTDNDSALDGLLDLTEICLSTAEPELSKDREKLEEVLDMETMYKIIEVTTGIVLNDPNLVQAVAEALTE